MTYPPQLDPPAPIRARLHSHRNPRRVSPVARIGDAVLLVCAAVLAVLLVRGPIAMHVSRYNAAAAANAVEAPSPVVKRWTLETLGPDGQALARYELDGEPRMLAGGVVTFRTRDGRRLFCSGLWRVVEGGRP